jgi:hypothetical protein
MSAVFIPLKSTRTSLGVPCFHEIGDASARLAGCGLIRIRVLPWLIPRWLRWSAPSAGAAMPLQPTFLPAFPTHAEPSSDRVLLRDLFGGIFRRDNHRRKFGRYAGQWNQTAVAMSLPLIARPPAASLTGGDSRKPKRSTTSTAIIFPWLKVAIPREPK